MLAGDAGLGFGRAPHATPHKALALALAAAFFARPWIRQPIAPEDLGQSMIRKSGNRFSEKIMLQRQSMIRKSGNRFSEKIMLQRQSMIRKSGNRFSEKIMLQREIFR